ncbi:VOC family protein [Alteromonas sp. KUL49]|uniref:VOC family protein n=1 Tax=Alteromonas sp. KUL49 TaxID=2480798 RepID=UPI00102F1C6C|nr:VOC family protein [Alteromonas sp. KUL49]TAP41347.1 VOC family protein [Alteromonas sp. KUL49]GEA10416.1 hypothetical protein KUL49_07910 [Alteromonas sp. KUL49]
MKLNQVTLPVRNMKVVVAFYQTLGFELIVDTPHYARFYCADGEATFSLALEDKLFNNGVTLYFEVEMLDETVLQLKQKGIQFIQDPVDQPYLWREAVLCDPSGNKLKLYWAGENRVNPPWRVTAAKGK